MSLIKQTMTEKNREAHRANGRKSRGPATPEGKERSRAAHLRHGLYSQGREEALAALGEDPAALAARIESTHAELAPTSDFQARISVPKMKVDTGMSMKIQKTRIPTA